MCRRFIPTGSSVVIAQASVPAAVINTTWRIPSIWKYPMCDYHITLSPLGRKDSDSTAGVWKAEEGDDGERGGMWWRAVPGGVACLPKMVSESEGCRKGLSSPPPPLYPLLRGL